MVAQGTISGGVVRNLPAPPPDRTTVFSVVNETLKSARDLHNKCGTAADMVGGSIIVVEDSAKITCSSSSLLDVVLELQREVRGCHEEMQRLYASLE